MPELEDEGSLNLNESVIRLTGFLTRRRLWILLPFCCIALVAVGVLSLLPNHYTSTATLLVVQQQVPQRYVVPNSTTDVTSALQAMKQEVLSRTQLLRMINDLGLYPKQRKRLAPEELVALMLSYIDIVPTAESPQQKDNKDFDAFRISFTAENPILAQQVTNTLTSLFINEYLRTGAEQANNTTSFLHQQVEQKGKELEAQEERLKDFKLKYVGELPEQQTVNLGILTGLQTQLANAMTSLDRARRDRALWQAQLDGTPRRRPALEGGGVALTTGNLNPAPLPNPIEGAQAEVNRLQGERSSLLSKGYKSEWPAVQANQKDLAQAESTLKRLRAAAAVPPAESVRPTQPPHTGTVPLLEAVDDPVVAQLKSNLEANRVEIENLTHEEARLKTSISQYENHLSQTPVREQQQAGILRDTEVLRLQYADLLKKEQDSQLATNLEKQQGGQQFRLIDPASLPTTPSSPKRIKMSIAGAFGGIGVGLALALLIEMRDTSFHTEKDLSKELAPPFVLGIPLLPTPAEVRRRKWQYALEWMAASAMAVVLLAAEYYVYRLG